MIRVSVHTHTQATPTAMFAYPTKRFSTTIKFIVLHKVDSCPCLL